MSEGELRKLLYRKGFHFGIFLRQLRVFVDGAAVHPTKSVIAMIEARPDFDYHNGGPLPPAATVLTGKSQEEREQIVLQMLGALK